MRVRPNSQPHRYDFSRSRARNSKPRFASVVLLLSGACLASEFHLYKSDDEGRAWVRSDEGLPSNSRINALHAIGHTAFVATDAGLFISTNDATSWTSAPLPGKARPLNFATINNALFVGTDGAGVFISRDLGKSWAPRNEGLSAKTVRALLAANGALYAGTDREGLFVLEPSAKDWKHSSEGLPAGVQIHDLTRVGSALFAGLYSQGLYRRDSPVKPFQKVGDKQPLVLAAHGNTLVIGLNPGGIFATDDLGQTFHRGNLPLLVSPDSPVWAAAGTQNRFFVGAASGIFSSDDNGRTWNSVAIAPGITSVAFFASTNFILAATTDYRPRLLK